MNIEGYETVHEVAKRLKLSDSRVHYMLGEGRFPDAVKLTNGATSPWLIPKDAKPTAIPPELVEEHRAKWRKANKAWRERQKEKK